MATKKRQGDVLGVSDVRPDRPAGTPPREPGSNPEGIEVGQHGTNSSTPSHKGATGIDMGAGGEGTDIQPRRH